MRLPLVCNAVAYGLHDVASGLHVGCTFHVMAPRWRIQRDVTAAMCRNVYLKTVREE